MTPKGKPLEGNRPAILGERTLLPIGLAAIIVVSACGGSWWLSAMYARQTDMNTRLERIEAAISDQNSQAVTSRDMRLWIMQFKAQNKGAKDLDIPEWVR